MEGSRSEAVFDSMNLNPQRFINETINTIEDIFDQAFDFYGSEASTHLKINRSDKSKELSNGIDRVRDMVQSVLDERLQLWEDYCLQHSFAVPEEFVLPESDESSVCYDGSNDLELDEQLDSLRHKLNLEGNRSVKLISELQALEGTLASNEKSTRLVNEALEHYDELSVDDMFKEMLKVASELHAGIERLKTRRMNADESTKTERLKNHGKEFMSTNSGGKLEDLEKFLAGLRKM